MAGDRTSGRSGVAHKLLLCVSLGVASILGLASTAFAAIHAGPRITKTAAAFAIPTTTKPAVDWTLNLRHGGQIIGSDSATTGSLHVTVPPKFHGMVQADVLRNSHWYSGNRFFVPGSGTGGGNGGKGGGGKGGGGKGGGTTTTTTTTTTVPPVQASATGPTAIPGYVPPAPITVATEPVTRASGGSALAFTGAGPTLWTGALAGLGFLVAGACLVGRRPQVAVVRNRDLETLLRPEG